MNIGVRPYQNDDYDEVRRLLIDGKLFYDLIDTREHFRLKTERDAESILVAVYDEKIIGTVFILEDNGWVAFIFHLVVNKENRGKGVGMRLMKEAERIIKNRNGYQVHLLIDTDNLGVVDFYKKIGYRESNLYRWMEKDL